MSVANRETRPAIFGLEGTSLTAEEGAFFHENRPWGIILFARNIETREQLCALTAVLFQFSDEIVDGLGLSRLLGNLSSIPDVADLVQVSLAILFE